MTSLRHLLLIAPETMARIDAAAGQSGIPLYDLMERAGQAVSFCVAALSAGAAFCRSLWRRQ